VRSRLCTAGSGSNGTFVHGTPTCILSRDFVLDLEDGTILCQLTCWRHCETILRRATPCGFALRTGTAGTTPFCTTASEAK
jgi:hypothetical protein